MSRFETTIDPALDEQLDTLRTKLGLTRSQDSELLAEMTALAAWALRQAALGRVIEARRGEEREMLVHEALERLQPSSPR